jgi:hypothetical protein
MSDSIWPESCAGCETYAPVRKDDAWRHLCLLPVVHRHMDGVVCIDRSATPPHRPPWCPKEATE